MKYGCGCVYCGAVELPDVGAIGEVVGEDDGLIGEVGEVPEPRVEALPRVELPVPPTPPPSRLTLLRSCSMRGS